MNDYDRAIGIYQGVLGKIDASRPNYQYLDRASVRNRLAEIYLLKNEPQMALEQSRLVIADRSADSGVVAEAYLQAGKAYDAMSERELAVAEYRKVLARQDITGLHDKARAYLKNSFAARR